MPLEINKIGINELELIQEFLTTLGSGQKSFRYFKNRPINVISKHFYTAILSLDGTPVAYGHLEKENGELWLGVAVSEKHRGKGYGKKMMIHLINYAKQENEPSISLTVDNDNKSAISLYEKLNFFQVAMLGDKSKWVLSLK